VEAAKNAIASPLLDVSIEGAKGVLYNITGGPDLTLFEVNEAADVIAKAVSPEADIFFGWVVDPNMTNEVKITVIATGFEAAAKPQPKTEEKIRPFGPLEADTNSDLDIPPFLRRAHILR